MYFLWNRTLLDKIRNAHSFNFKTLLTCAKQSYGGKVNQAHSPQPLHGRYVISASVSFKLETAYTHCGCEIHLTSSFASNVSFWKTDAHHFCLRVLSLDLTLGLVSLYEVFFFFLAQLDD